MENLNNEELSTKEKIYREAFALFYDYGFKKVSLRRIASASGISHNTVTYYYKSKEGITQEIELRFRLCAIKEFHKFWDEYKRNNPSEDDLKYEVFAWKTIQIHMNISDKKFARFTYESRKEGIPYSTSGSGYGANYITTTAKAFLDTKYESDYIRSSFGFDVINYVLPICIDYFNSYKMDKFECLWLYFSIYRLLLLPECTLTKEDAKSFYDKYLVNYEIDSEELINKLHYDATLSQYNEWFNWK